MLYIDRTNDPYPTFIVNLSVFYWSMRTPDWTSSTSRVERDILYRIVIGSFEDAVDYFRIQIKAPDSRFSITIAVRTGRFLFLFQEKKTFFSYIQ